jgi:hypothetical protein
MSMMLATRTDFQERLTSYHGMGRRDDSVSCLLRSLGCLDEVNDE